MAAEQRRRQRSFSFGLLANKKFAFQQDARTSELFLKWSMLGRITAQAFNFDQQFNLYRKQEFVLDFFKDPCVVSNLKVLGARGLWKSLDTEVLKANVEVVPCTRVSMDVFDPLYSHGILRPTGHILKCFDDFYADFDELRKMLLIEDSEKYEIISPEDRQEFLFQLFKHFCLGGELCQYEDVIEPYIETARSVYKDMVSVQKDPATDKISIISTVLKVSAYDNSGLCYPSNKDKEQTFAYLAVDPLKRHVYVLYHCFGVGLFSVPQKDIH